MKHKLMISLAVSQPELVGIFNNFADRLLSQIINFGPLILYPMYSLQLSIKTSEVYVIMIL